MMRGSPAVFLPREVMRPCRRREREAPALQFYVLAMRRQLQPGARAPIEHINSKERKLENVLAAAR
jgi:hypothetical protein